MDIGIKAGIRYGLMMEGIDPNDLKPGGGSSSDYSYKFVAESLMLLNGISVAELIEGSAFEHLEKGKTIFGRDIKEGENVYGQNLNDKKKKMEDAAASFAAFEKMWKEDHPDHDYSKHEDLATRLMKKAMDNMKKKNNNNVEAASSSDYDPDKCVDLATSLIKVANDNMKKNNNIEDASSD